MSMIRTAMGTAALCASLSAVAQVSGETPRTALIEVKAGGYKPLIDREAALAGRNPYNDTFGAGAMLLVELEGERELWQGFGTLSAGISVGYAQKSASATIPDASGNTVATSSDQTGLYVVPIRLMAIYRLDYPAFHLGIPLVPYIKAGPIYAPWWSTKGSGIDYVNGNRAAGGKWGYGGTLGVSFLLDVLEPRLARDFDVDAGVNHTYLFAEFTWAEVNDLGRPGLDLSSRHWMFGLGFEL